MAEQKSFKERVKEEAITNAKMFKEFFVDCEYLICSEAFEKKPYYIIGAHTSNYEHLTGVSSSISADVFFSKCLDGTLQEGDFAFSKKGQSEAEVKGSVRRKINALPSLSALFEAETLVEEDFVKNRVKCSFAAGKTACTLGFANSFPSKPQSLMKGNQLNLNKAKPAELVLRRKRGEPVFDKIILGDSETIAKYISEIQPLLSEELIGLAGLSEQPDFPETVDPQPQPSEEVGL